RVPTVALLHRSNRRVVVNVVEVVRVLEALHKLGVIRYVGAFEAQPSDGILSQVRLFGGIDIALGGHGGGFNGIAFMRPNAIMLESLSPWGWYWYRSYSLVCGILHGFIAAATAQGGRVDWSNQAFALWAG